MAALKTKKTDASVAKFIASVPDKTRREDAAALLELLRKTTKAEPKMWGKAIIGFGSIILKYDSGRELDWFPVGFSPRKASLVIYYRKYDNFEDDLARLGKHKTGGGCLYINKLADIDMKVLSAMAARSVKMK